MSATKYDVNGLRQSAWLRNLVVVIALASSFASWGREPNYVPASQIALDLILAPPPKVGTQAHEDDLRAVLNAQQQRTEAQAQAAKADAELSAFRVGDMLGSEFTPEKLPFTAQF